MSRISLNLDVPQHSSIRSFVDEKGIVRALPLLRLFTRMLVGRDPSRGRIDHRRSYRTVIDSGSPLSLFPQRFWTRFQDQITWLGFSPGEVGDELPTLNVGAAAHPYRLGLVWVGASDDEGRKLEARRMLAQFAEDVTPPIPFILHGLWGGGLLDGRRLIQEPSLDAPFGERWWISDY